MMATEDRAALRGIGDRLLAELVESIRTGAVCSQCHEAFVHPHGHKVACAYCWRRLSAEDRLLEKVQLAKHDEQSAARAKTRARKRRKEKRNGVGEA